MTLTKPCQSCRSLIEKPGKRQRFCQYCIKQRLRYGAKKTNDSILLRVRFPDTERDSLKNNIKKLEERLGRLERTLYSLTSKASK